MENARVAVRLLLQSGEPTWGRRVHWLRFSTGSSYSRRRVLSKLPDGFILFTAKRSIQAPRRVHPVGSKGGMLQTEGSKTYKTKLRKRDPGGLVPLGESGLVAAASPRA